MLSQPPTERRAGPRGRVRGALARRRPQPTPSVYDAAMAACDAAYDQIAAAPDARVRYLALCQLVTAHRVASLVATDMPWPALDGGDGRRVRQVHRDICFTLEWLVVTEGVLVGQPFAGQRPTGETGLPPSWEDVLTRLSAVREPSVRAELIIEFSLVAEPIGGPVTGTLHRLAIAYLQLAGVRAAETLANRMRDEIRVHIATRLHEQPTSAVRRCRSCGCTDADCTPCIEATGVACTWAEHDLCTRCATTPARHDTADLLEGTS